MSQARRRVGVVGATGLAGQQFVAALADHPSFVVTALAASQRSSGRSYRDALRDASGQVRWYADAPLPESLAQLVVADAEAVDARELDLVFSCVESGPARTLEPLYAQHCAVISTASAFRYEPDVPLLIPGVNMEHARLIEQQRARRGWKGFIAPNPNCTTVGLAMTLAPLHRDFGVEQVFMTSLQAVSGAGRSPGVIGLDILDNVIPFIAGEEEKVEKETAKILGRLDGGAIQPAEIAVSCTCTRVAVLEGHTEAVFVRLARAARAEEVRASWTGFGADFTGGRYPTAPARLIEVSDDPYRPQPRLDRDRGAGMTTVVGRLRPDPAMANGWKYMLVSHNTKMGAAKGCILTAEYLLEQGFLGG
jgi:aspartate-semialdehyde dehydrogenase